MDIFSKIIKQSEEYQLIEENIRQGVTPVNVSGLTESGKAHLVASLCQNVSRQGVVVTDSEYSAKKLFEDLMFFYGENTLHYPAKEMEFYKVDAKSNEYVNQRLKVLQQIVNSTEDVVVVMSVDALLQFTIDYEAYVNSFLEIALGHTYDINELAEKLVHMGFIREDMVEGRGQFSIRGGIIDIFPPTMDNPCRFEFFGDEIDSIRTFDPITQVSIEEIDSVTVSAVDEGFGIKAQNPSILQYIHKKAIIFFDEPHKVSERAEGFLWDINETVKGLIEKEVIVQAEETYIHDYHQTLSALLKRPFVGLYALPHSCKDYRPKASVSVTMGAVNAFLGKLEFLHNDLHEWIGKDYKIIMLAGSSQKVDGLYENLKENKFDVAHLTDDTQQLISGRVYLCQGALKKGFYFPLIKFIIISDEEIFGKAVRKPARKKKLDSASRIKSFADLDIGDYVVHQTHGIGQYVGLDTLLIEGSKKDFLKIKYNGDDYLYVPTDQLDLLQKYIGKDGHVRLNKMGGADFSKQKAKVKKSTIELAQELIALYSARQQSKGYAFSPDTAWQKEFENKFPYDETDDQLKSIEEVKKDMESERPMDRLLCGDVGYGKTEVALRAAFKAVMDGKQVAYLAPTTVLTMQHYNTFVSRMKDYPIKIEMLSRFKTASEQKKILKLLKSGGIDIIIGTHRLLGKDIEFSDLGLLVVDEEQRFGVKHKERLKEMKHNVDVLTLSATPIPRTLHMSMINIKDMSVLTEPPEDRYPIQTFVMEQNMAVLSDAIKKELSRGGQVYYLHNRVQSIQSTARRLLELIPDAKIKYAHGQMEENALEDIMMDMLEGEIDVLVCTTIIETGLDIPNVNTIIIEDADKMGLSQLYQLKGRVGRSNRRAFAYLTYRRDKVLNEIAVKRLQAIKEFTEFGSGFKIAMRDLEIRGAGNILGSEQHGHMDSVGYDMYCKLLAESVGELQGIPQEPVWQPTVDISVDAFIPPAYIKNHTMRLDIYKKIAAIEDEKDYMDVYDEVLDRFGGLPDSVEALLDIALIKAIAHEINISEVALKEERASYYFKGTIPFEAVSELIGNFNGRILLSAGEKPYMVLKLNKKELFEPLKTIKSLLQTYKVLHNKSN